MTRTKSVVRAVRAGGVLEAVALKLASSLDDPETPPSARAALARELRLTVAALAASGGTVKGDVLDDLASRRQARLDAG